MTTISSFKIGKSRFMECTILLLAFLTIGKVSSQVLVDITTDEGSPLEIRGKEQLERILEEFNLTHWIFTKTIKINSYVTPHSHPVLTLNTKYIGQDELQLATFLHEQAHWFEASPEYKTKSELVMANLKEMYPEVPFFKTVGTKSDYSTYLHLMICWYEFDGLVEFLGREKAKSIIRDKDHYQWVYDKVLVDTQKIKEILIENGMMITPSKGL